MAKQLLGKEVTAALNERIKAKASVLEEKAEDYGDLTEDEIRELKNIYEQFEVIGEKILGDEVWKLELKI